MSEYECPNCGHLSHLFKKGGGEALAKDLKLPLLESIPFDPTLVEEGDSGLPVVLSRPESEVAKRYLSLAQKMAAELSAMLSGARAESPIVTAMEPNAPAKMFKVNWSDGKQSVVTFKDLRYHCPCANCVDENTGYRKIKKEDVKDDVSPQKVSTVGNYAISVQWSDGHSTGIYAYDYLRKLLTHS